MMRAMRERKKLVHRSDLDLSLKGRLSRAALFFISTIENHESLCVALSGLMNPPSHRRPHFRQVGLRLSSAESSTLQFAHLESVRFFFILPPSKN